MARFDLKKEAELFDISERRRKRRFYVIGISAILLFYLLLFGSYKFLFRSSFFWIKNINIEGNKQVSDDQILTLLKAKALGNSFWRLALTYRSILAWPDGFPSQELVFLPQLRRLEIQKDYRNFQINIKVEERNPYGIWCLGGGECWWFDREGMIFKRAFMAEGNLLNSVTDHSGRKLGLNIKVLPDKLLQSIFLIFEVLNESDLSVKEIKLENLGLEEVSVATYDGPMIYFSLRFGTENMLAVIKSLMKKPDFNKLEYVDFRVENKVYYK